MNEFCERIIKYKYEILTLCIYVVFSIVMFAFHEPWYDEIQAFSLARDASIKELIFYIPHYEGHPPLYSLLLAPFAKAGLPFELSLRLVTFPFSVCATYLLVFKAPFKRIVRCVLPFTFFVYYNYTIICRPYALLFCSFMLAAYFYKNRNSKPFSYIFSLMFMCLCSLYGILFAGCFCIVWTYEILIELKNKRLFSKVLYDKRFWSLVFI